MDVLRAGTGRVGRMTGAARALLTAMRPLQWSKNLFVFAGLVFAEKLANPALAGRSAAAFAVFCALSSATYLVNDVCDIERDRLHPRKRLRPVASGHLSAPAALVSAAVLTAGGLAGAALLGRETLAVAGGYWLLMLAYTLALKREVLLDVFTIAAGFVLRAVAGAVAISVSISPWLIVCATLLALLLALCKRRAELVALPDAEAHRGVLAHYTTALLDQLIAIVAASTAVAYLLYAFQSETANRHAALIWTAPFVLYGLFRYLYLVYVRGQGESPETTILRDPQLTAALLFWAILSGALLWGK